MQAVQRIEREKSMDGGKEKEEVDDPHTSAAKQKRPLRIGTELDRKSTRLNSSHDV